MIEVRPGETQAGIDARLEALEDVIPGGFGGDGEVWGAEPADGVSSVDGVAEVGVTASLEPIVVGGAEGAVLAVVWLVPGLGAVGHCVVGAGHAGLGVEAVDVVVVGVLVAVAFYADVGVGLDVSRHAFAFRLWDRTSFDCDGFGLAVGAGNGTDCIFVCIKRTVGAVSVDALYTFTGRQKFKPFMCKINVIAILNSVNVHWMPLNPCILNMEQSDVEMSL